MGYQTPNIDRLASEGALFTDWYGQQSCTGRTGPLSSLASPIRTGLTKVGLPGSTLGLQKEDPTIADLLKPLGYATGSSGRTTWAIATSSCLPCTASMSSSGNSTNLNAEEEPENPDYPKNPEFRRRFGPRGVLHNLVDEQRRCEPWIRNGAGSASRRSRTPGRWTRSACRRSTRSFSTAR